MPSLSECLGQLPLVAILRGLPPDAAAEIGDALYDTGFRIIEVPLNSPQPLHSIAILGKAFGDRALIGAGTVRRAAEAGAIATAGGKLVVMPHCDVSVIRSAKAEGLYVIAGVLSPTEAFAALDAGADALKLFPAEALPPSVVKALTAVLPREVCLMPVGGIRPESLAPYWAAGARAFGLGSALYRPGAGAKEVAARAQEFVAAYRQLRAGRPGNPT
jgi:2-dehydro-3-deoxyphosphogalactonate aldolase